MMWSAIGDSDTNFLMPQTSNPPRAERTSVSTICRSDPHLHSGNGLAEDGLLTDGLAGFGCDWNLVDPQPASGHGNRYRAVRFGKAVGGGQGARVEAEACHLGGEPLGAVAVDGFAAVEREAQARQVDVGDDARVLADDVVGHVRRGSQSGTAFGHPLQTSERRCRERGRRRLPEFGTTERVGEQEGQSHVVVQRQPRAAGVGW
jgi:hypothetical protein